MGDITGIIVFIEGMATFLSPCILPLLPIYISYITGYSMEELEEGGWARKSYALYNAVFFVLGFSVVFILMGLSASAIGRYLAINRVLMRRISGIMIIAMGLFISGVLRIPFLEADKRFRFKGLGGKGITSFIMGAAFGFGWTPCVGPILGSVLMLAGASATIDKGVTLLAVYSLGLGVPFLLSAAVIDRFAKGLDLISPYLSKIKLVSGILLIIMGIMVFAGYTADFQNMFGGF
ncbi:MAG: DsbD domain-containing protein [Firmicutes bacterium]|nr:DsbD domain-containing protein [Bacillota bacterium]MDI6705106.1 cytochrome c biogenesis protein CcdA [Bacillota bacterium]